jgi:CheY-like chemotaxis protein
MDIDVEKVELILSNLISNAYKYTDKGGTVKLIVEDKDKTVELKVQDNGIGISNKELDKIFRQFYRVKDTTEVEGSGIGLSFVKSLVQSHGGEINVVSKIGKGSEFTVSLPKIQQKKEVKKFESVVIEQEQKDTENILPVSENLQSPAATKTILIIDDEEETREILERYLSRTYLIIQASDGEIGLKIAEEQSPDLIICDVMMPNIDGFAFLSFLKENKKMANIPVIMLTGKTMDEDKISAYKYGADDYIIKPVSLKYLQARIENLLAKNPVLTVNDQQKRYTKEEQTFILNCKSIIDDNINNGMLNVSFMAEQMQMGYSSFYKKIKSITGLSVMEFINDYRIFKAVQLFKDGETNVTNVAEKCGFNDASSFRAAFKNKMGMSPKQYVQRL